MITIGWIWLVLAVAASLLNLYNVADGGTTKSAGDCALGSVIDALLAVWIFMMLMR